MPYYGLMKKENILTWTALNLQDSFILNLFTGDAFEAFGELERVCVACSYNLKPLGYGFVEFSNKKRAELAIRKINENPFVLTK